MSPPRYSNSNRRGLLRFVAGVVAIGVVWLIVLPRLGNVPAVRARIDANEARGINPGAMYYTELEAMPGIMEEVDRRRESAGEAFWTPSWDESKLPANDANRRE